MEKFADKIRIFEIVISAATIVFLSPIFFTVSLILRFTGDGAIFYQQKRIGRGESEISILKFSTMIKNSDRIGTGELTLKDDPRVFPFGRFLRKTKLNELPQLWNVLKGDIGFIGPRPQTRQFYDLYSKENRSYISKNILFNAIFS